MHVAFTGLSPDRFEALGRLLDTWEREAAEAEAAEADSRRSGFRGGGVQRSATTSTMS